MPFVNESDLAKSIRNNEIQSVYYFFGKDVAAIELYTKRLVERLVSKENREFCFHSYDGKDFSISNFYDDCEFLPFGAERSVISVNDLNAESIPASDLDYIIDTLKNLPETTTVIINITGVDLFGGKKYMNAKNKKLSDACSKIGVVCDFQLKSLSDITKSVMVKCQKQGASISKAAAEQIVKLCLSNTVMINSEIDKLCSYVNGQEITVEIVNDMVSKQLDTSAFELAKAAVRFDTKRAMKLLNELYEQQLDSIPVLSALSMSFIDLYRARAAVSCGKTKNDICSDFNYKGREFSVDNAIRDCANLPVERIRKCIQILAETDIELKSQRTDGRLLVEKAVIKMMSRERV